MEMSEYEKMYQVETDYWWFVGKRKIVANNLPAKGEGLKVLDIGCGTGIVLGELKKSGYDVYGVDMMPVALQFCRRRGLKNLTKASVLKMPFAAASFDIALCLDVLYHKGISNDVAALKEIFRILKPGGTLLITDSACKSLYGRHDIAVHARERYSLGGLCSKVKKSGFNIKKASYFNTLLFPPIYIMRKIDNIINKNRPAESSIGQLPRPINFLLKSLFLLEISMLKHINLPFGLSVLCVAEKPKPSSTSRYKRDVPKQG